jgi:Domain of unknown function (DUF4159)/Aerotolerance regulator N-terminal
MFGLPLAFTIPTVLAGLVALPVLYWLLRLTPPPPARAMLPTLPIVRDLERREETPAHTPWWLLLLRLLIAALVILAMAGPLWNPDQDNRAGRGPLLVVLDDGWSSAADWKRMTDRAQSLIESAGAAGRPVALRAVTEDPTDIVPGAATRALETLRGLAPQPHVTDRRRQEAAIGTFLDRNSESGVAWITDSVTGLEDGGVLGALAQKGGDRFAAFAPAAPLALGVTDAQNLPEVMTVRVLRASAAGPAVGMLRATDLRGRNAAEARYQFADGALETTARFETPLEIRNDISRVDSAEQLSAGGVTLLDGRNKRRRVGIISSEGPDNTQPLLSPAYFVLRALQPFADVREAPRGAADPYGRLLEDGVTVMVLADAGTLPPAVVDRLRTFVNEGGMLIRFASRRVAQPTDTLLPVRLRRSERVMGGALSWDTPRKLATFATGSPFEGMRVPADVTVSQQILAEPDAALQDKTWAALEDGTPLITGERRGKGAVVLYHVTADTSWSSLPLSAAFVETLRQLANMGAAAGETAGASGLDLQQRAAALAPIRVLDGFGAFRGPTATAEPVPANFPGPASQKHPPGFYGATDGPLAVNTLPPAAKLTALDLTGVTVRPLETRPALDLRPWLLLAALILFLIDALAALALSGALARGLRFVRPAAAAAVLGAGLAMIVPDAAFAQSTPAVPPARPSADKIPSYRADDIEAALVTRLAFIITGDREIDEISRQGLQGLSRALGTRTSLDPGEPIGLDPARDEMAFYPLIYWPMTPNRPMPTEAAIRKIDAYMKNGGTIIFDTRDALNNRGGNATTPETQYMRRILAAVDVPDIEPVPKDHVVTKTFYILQDFVGRYAVGRTWIEVIQRSADLDKTRPAQAGDRVSPIIITGNDLAAAWAVDRLGQPRFPLVPGDARQRELALRGGINLVIYALTGNYKADQVHVPALLERLGQ